MTDSKGAFRHRGADSAKIITVIEVKARAGKGTPTDPNRFITEYWTLEGERLATVDSEFPDSLPYPSTLKLDKESMLRAFRERSVE